MSYIKILFPDGKERGLKFNQGALIMFQEKVDAKNYAATTGYALVYAGLMANAYVKSEEVDFTFENVCDWVDELKSEIVLSVINCFKETQIYKNLLPENKDEDKKKLKQKTTKKSALKLQAG
jgi:hypothetical protein